MTTRDALIFCARAYLRESRARRIAHRAYSFLLLDWAARCRREAMAVGVVQGQMGLF